MKTNTLVLPIILALVVFAATFLISLIPSVQTTQAAGGFLPAAMASSSSVTVGTSPASAVFATSSPNCSARIIGTQFSGVMITFTDKNGDVPSAVKGYWQPASSTVAYDSGLFGCGAVKVYSFVSQSIMAAETF